MTSESFKHHGLRYLHLKGHDFFKTGFRLSTKASKKYKYVMKSDIADLYSSINYEIVIKKTARIDKDSKIMNIIQSIVNRLKIDDTNHMLINCSIPHSIILYPLFVVLLLKLLGAYGFEKNVHYAQHMNDWLVFTNGHRHLWLVRKMHQGVHQLKFKLVVSKTL